MTRPKIARSKDELAAELDNFVEITSKINPTADKIPRLDGIDIYGELMPLRGAVGGDHILFVDFNRRYDLEARIVEAEAEGRTEVADKLRLTRQRAGVLVADISGHRVTDAVIASMLHQCFLLGALYELDRYGEITTRLFEHLNTRFFKTTSVNKYFTMVYGEISVDGRFRFLSAAHQPPIVFSRKYGRVMPIAADRIVSFPPVGMFPLVDDVAAADAYHYKRRYTVNEINLMGSGDVLMLCTDGLTEHADGRFLAERVEPILLDGSEETAETLCATLRREILELGAPADDISFVVIKKR